MSIRQELKSALIQLDPKNGGFQDLALEVFRFQYAQNPIYRQYAQSLKKTPNVVDRIEKIPFLPIELFKSHQILSGPQEPQMVFASSGTTSTETSKHYVSDLSLYETLSRSTFEQFYGPLTDYHIFALLPSYLERNNSSLVYMVQNFIYHSFSTLGGFFLDNPLEMVRQITDAAKDKRKVLLLGVTFALLDLAENREASEVLKSVSHKLTVMETGGMKGKRKELIREELHEQLTEAWSVPTIHSEYGMTELLSQGYSKGAGWFSLPKSMKVLIREINDPFSFYPHFAVGEKQDSIHQKTGGINVIDLANIDSCSFIETKDLGVFSSDYDQFSISGRFDNSDLRGCNLLVG